MNQNKSTIFPKKMPPRRGLAIKLDVGRSNTIQNPAESLTSVFKSFNQIFGLKEGGK